MRKILLIIIVLGFVAAAHNASASIILLDDDFNSENGGMTPRLNYSNLQNWDVTYGSVDLCGPEYYTYHNMPSWVGSYLDLDGTTWVGGKLESKTIFDLYPGIYSSGSSPPVKAGVRAISSVFRYNAHE